MTARLSPQREAELAAVAERAVAEPFFVSDCEGELQVWREKALIHVRRDESGEITMYSFPSTYRVTDEVIRIDLDTWDDGEDATDDQRRQDIGDLATARAGVSELLAELAAVRAERDEARERVDEVERRYTFDTADLRREVDHHEGGKKRWRKRAREAEAMVRELKRPAELKRRAETRSSFTALISEAEQAQDHEGAASLAEELAKVEAKWQREDEEATS